MKPKRSEAEIKKAICDYLKAKGYLVFRMNSGSMFGQYKGKTWRVQMNPAGTADLLVFRDFGDGHNWPYWIEVKSSAGKQSLEQVAFQKIVMGEGHGYILARSVEDVQELGL